MCVFWFVSDGVFVIIRFLLTKQTWNLDLAASGISSMICRNCLEKKKRHLRDLCSVIILTWNLTSLQLAFGH